MQIPAQIMPVRCLTRSYSILIGDWTTKLHHIGEFMVLEGEGHKSAVYLKMALFLGRACSNVNTHSVGVMIHLVNAV